MNIEYNHTIGTSSGAQGVGSLNTLGV